MRSIESSSDRLLSEILACMQPATAIHGYERLLLTTDDDLDANSISSPGESLQGGPEKTLVIVSTRLQLKTSSLRKRQYDHARKSRHHGKCRALTNRSLNLLRAISDRFQLQEVNHHMQIQVSRNAHVYCVPSLDNTTTNIIKIHANDKRQQLKRAAQREFALLSQAYEKQLNVPEPVLCLGHIVVSRAVSTTCGSRSDHKSVPFLRDLTHSARYDRTLCYLRILEGMRKLYQEAGIVHGNVSENTVVYNCELYYAKCWFTDFGYAVDTQQPDHLKLLANDVARVNAMFLHVVCGREDSKHANGVLPNDVVMAYVTMKELSRKCGEYVRGPWFSRYGEGPIEIFQ